MGGARSFVVGRAEPQVFGMEGPHVPVPVIIYLLIARCTVALASWLAVADGRARGPVFSGSSSASPPRGRFRDSAEVGFGAREGSSVAPEGGKSHVQPIPFPGARPRRVA